MKQLGAELRMKIFSPKHKSFSATERWLRTCDNQKIDSCSTRSWLLRESTKLPGNTGVLFCPVMVFVSVSSQVNFVFCRESAKWNWIWPYLETGLWLPVEFVDCWTACPSPHWKYAKFALRWPGPFLTDQNPLWVCVSVFVKKGSRLPCRTWAWLEQNLAHWPDIQKLDTGDECLLVFRSWSERCAPFGSFQRTLSRRSQLHADWQSGAQEACVSLPDELCEEPAGHGHHGCQYVRQGRWSDECEWVFKLLNSVDWGASGMVAARAMIFDSVGRQVTSKIGC